ncbi:MAG: GatB/YqeY domain-containing protein [Nevskiales bacterium]
MSLKLRIQEDMKAAMKSGDKARLGVIRLLAAALKQKEVDERITLDDAAVMSIVEKQIKQRKDSVTQYQAGGRSDLAAAESAEITVLEGYLPARLSDGELEQIIADSIAAAGAAGPKDMGKVMGLVKPKVAGRADMGLVSARIKAKLTG